MRIFINRKPVVGPWGGGNKTLFHLVSGLVERGHELFFDNLPPDLDLMICFDPRPNHVGISYDHLLLYRDRNNTPIMQRVGDVGTHGKPDLTNIVKRSTHMSDFVIFPSLWARDYISYYGDHKIIPNGPLSGFYTPRYRSDLPKFRDPIEAVTHHWSDNPMKGFDLYKNLDENHGKVLKFNYIGRHPVDISFKNYHGTKGDEELFSYLGNFDVYITASKLEAGANHVLEAMAAGLPIFYAAGGGSIAEYCENFGQEYSDEEDLLEKISQSFKDEELWMEIKNKVVKYDRTIYNVVNEYIEEIERIK